MEEESSLVPADCLPPGWFFLCAHCPKKHFCSPGVNNSLEAGWWETTTTTTTAAALNNQCRRARRNNNLWPYPLWLALPHPGRAASRSRFFPSSSTPAFYSRLSPSPHFFFFFNSCWRPFLFPVLGELLETKGEGSLPFFLFYKSIFPIYREVFRVKLLNFEENRGRFFISPILLLVPS